LQEILLRADLTKDMIWNYNFPYNIISTVKEKYEYYSSSYRSKDSKLDTIILQPCLELERGYCFSINIAGTITKETFYGSLYSFNGDHMGQIELAGLVGPRGNKPSIYSTLERVKGRKSLIQMKYILRKETQHLMKSTGYTFISNKALLKVDPTAT